MDSFVVKECNDTSVIKALFTEYSQIKVSEKDGIVSMRMELDK